MIERGNDCITRRQVAKLLLVFSASRDFEDPAEPHAYHDKRGLSATDRLRLRA